MFHKEELKQVLAKSNLIRGNYFDEDYFSRNRIEDSDDFNTIPACAVSHLALALQPTMISERIIDFEVEGELHETVNDDEYLVQR